MLHLFAITDFLQIHSKALISGAKYLLRSFAPFQCCCMGVLAQPASPSEKCKIMENYKLVVTIFFIITL